MLWRNVGLVFCFRTYSFQLICMGSCHFQQFASLVTGIDDMWFEWGNGWLHSLLDRQPSSIKPTLGKFIGHDNITFTIHCHSINNLQSDRSFSYHKKSKNRYDFGGFDFCKVCKNQNKKNNQKNLFFHLTNWNSVCDVSSASIIFWIYCVCQ